MVLPLDVLLHISAVEPDVAQVAARVALRLVAEVLRLRIAALASGSHCPGAHAIAELDHRHEAVAGGAVHLLRAAVGTRAERGQRAPAGRRERNRDARLAVVERLDDGAVDPLVAIDLAPRRLP